MGIRWLTIALGFGLLAAACGSDEVVNTGSADALFVEALTNARSSWAAVGVDTYYYEVEAHTHGVDGSEPPCGFGEPLIVEVVDGVVESARAKLSGCSIRAAADDRSPLTVTEWFDFFEAEVEEHGTSITELTANFDAAGTPIEFYAGGAQRFAEVGFREFSVGLPDNSAFDCLFTERS